MWHHATGWAIPQRIRRTAVRDYSTGFLELALAPNRWA